MSHNWNRDRASEHIKRCLEQVSEVTVVDFKRDMSLENIPVNKAYRMNAVHMYADILNLDEMLRSTEEEGVVCHRRTLRFLNLHYRAVHRILARSEARRVDFHNQRLHGVVFKPYGSDEKQERNRVERSVAIGQIIIDVLNKTGDADEKIANADVRIGVDSGEALAVNNGRNGGREPLFLGAPANQAAKLSGAKVRKGIYLTNSARKLLDLEEVKDPATAQLTMAEIAACQEAAELEFTADDIVDEWKDDLEKNPIGQFQFSGHTPPLRTLDISSLTPANSRRQDAVSMYADIDNFTAYVSDHMHENPENVVKIFHVLRAELDRVLSSEFDGRRIRFIGDCIHGLLCEGTAQNTDAEATISTATLCAAALQSSFKLALDKLVEAETDVDQLSLAIGFEFGPMTMTRLGLKGDRVRCAVSRGVLASEAEQRRCDGLETAIGTRAYKEASGAIKNLFGPSRKVSGLEYNEAVEVLADEEDAVATKTRADAYSAVAPALVRAADIKVRPYTKLP